MEIHRVAERGAGDRRFEAEALLEGKGAEVLRHPLVEKARRSCFTDFEGITRKVPDGSDAPKLPYAVHPDGVARRLAAAGFGPEVVAAGYLHDHLEDLPRLWTRERLAQEFTPYVAELVDWVSEQDKSPPWAERKAAYAARLREAPPEAVSLSMADKTENLSDSAVYLREGFPLESFLKQGWRANSERFHDLGRIFSERGSPEMLPDFVSALLEFDRLGAPFDYGAGNDLNAAAASKNV